MEVIGQGLARVLELGENKVRIKVGGELPKEDECDDVPPQPAYEPQKPEECTDSMPSEGLGWENCKELKEGGGCELEGAIGYCCTTCFGCKGILQCGGI